MQSLRGRKASIVAALTTTLLVLSGCVDLVAIAKFAAISKSAADTFPLIVQDMQDSCTRRAELMPSDQRAQVSKDCERFATLKPNLLAAQGVVTGYLGTMADLSTNQPAGYSKSLDGISGKLKASGLDEKQTAAGASLASKITDASLHAFRAAKLKEVIRDSNQSLQDYITGLRKITGNDYGNLLELEELALDDYYRAALKEHGGKEPLTAILIERQWRGDKEKLNERRQAAKAYLGILDNIGKAHQELYDHRNKLNAKELFSLISPEVEAIGTSVYEIYKAF